MTLVKIVVVLKYFIVKLYYKINSVLHPTIILLLFTHKSLLIFSSTTNNHLQVQDLLACSFKGGCETERAVFQVSVCVCVCFFSVCGNTSVQECLGLEYAASHEFEIISVNERLKIGI